MISQETIQGYLIPTSRHSLRVEADQIRNALGVHSRKEKPTDILNAFRPNEKPEHKKYRESAYKPNTYGWFFKVLDQFEKIRTAEDWRVAWPELDENLLERYVNQDYPEHDSFENWLFGFQLKNIVDDPNGLIAFLPRDIKEILDTGTTNPSRNFEPIAFYFDSTTVVDFTETLAVVTFPERDPGNAALERQVTMLFDKDEVAKVYTRRSGTQTETVVESYVHNMGYMPVIACGGLMSRKEDDRWLFDSFIAPAVPAWDEAIEGESDHKVDKALHLHPDRWRMMVERCENPRCTNGKVLDPQLGPVSCEMCEGKGYRDLKSPFGEMVVTPMKTGMNDTQLPPMPPAGYIERPIQSIRLTKELANEKIYEGLQAINLEMIGESLLNQSGKAKEYDRQEINNYVGKVAKHLVNNILKPGYFFLNCWINLSLDEATREKFLPKMVVPRKFDLITTEVWMDRVSAYKKDGANPAALAEAEIKLAERQHGADSLQFKIIRDAIQLDPMYGHTPEQKLEASMSGGCSMYEYIITTKIHYFIRRAGIESQNKFYDWEYKEKVAKLVEYAKETESEKAMQALPPANPKIQGVA